MKNVKLSSQVTIEQYNHFILCKDREKISDFIYERLMERYIAPIESSKNKNGFCSIALSCLLIECLESFYQGLVDTKNKSGPMFKSFFNHCEKFKDFRSASSDFYYYIRCGILHQGETTNGWRILRSGNLIDIEARTINATKFLSNVKDQLIEYCNELKKRDWRDSIWDKFRCKMNGIIAHCEK